MTALGKPHFSGEKCNKLTGNYIDCSSVPEKVKPTMESDVPKRTRRLLLIMPGILMGFISLCLLTAYFCVTQSNKNQPTYDRSRIHEEKFLLVASHDGHRTWNHVTVDGQKNTVEVEVPTFGQFQQSIIVYDFEEGFMVNKDLDGKRCFVKRIHDYLEGSLENLNRFKGSNLTVFLEDVPVRALPGLIPPSLLRSTAGDRLATLCSGFPSYWIVVQSDPLKKSDQPLTSYNTVDGPIITKDPCDVRVADILSVSLLCVRFSKTSSTTPPI